MPLSTDASRDVRLAVVDRVIRTLKVIMAKAMTVRRSGSWSAVLQKSVEAYNKAPHEALMDTPPRDVDKNQELQYDLEKAAGEKIAHNHDEHISRMRKLRDEGAFRDLLPRSTWQRASQPRYGSRVHLLEGFVGPMAQDTEGRLFDAKLVAPVPASSAQQDVPKELRGGNPALQARQRRELQPYADMLVEHMRERGRDMSIHEVSAFMRASTWWEAMQEERLQGKVALTRFLQLYPDLFQVFGEGTRTKVRLA